MIIAIIGAGISGLAAGIELKKSGHEVIIFEKSRGYGGRMATRYAENDKNLKLDHGVPFIISESDDFGKLIEKLSAKNILKEWKGKLIFRDQNGKQKVDNQDIKRFNAPNGMNSIGKFLGNDLDIRFSERIKRLAIDEKQHNWRLISESGIIEKIDALIISAPAPQAVELLSTAGKGINAQSMIKELDKVKYAPQFALMLTYNHKDEPDWGMMNVDDEIINFISYESKKRDLDKTAIIVHSTPDFATKYLDKDREKVTDLMLERLISLIGKWADYPEWKQTHLWRYSQTRNWLPYDFMEISGNDTPLALVGSYMKGKTVESAYLSGLKLARHWEKKFSEKNNNSKAKTP
jgi:predicted NAD/FAD-dependent oxidoreductase